MENILFSEMNISKEVKKAVAEMGFEEPTPIQAQTIPLILDGNDILGLSQTGSGKTCAFGIPAIEMADTHADGIETLILCPTRELAIQISEELKNVSKYKHNIKILPVYGGQPIDRQIFSLKKKPQIVIGTPGRVMDHMRRHTLKLSNLKMIVLDEADEMLNMGFREDIDLILQSVPEKRQTILFSATMAPAIKDIINKYQKNTVEVKSVHKELTVPSIEQYYYEVRDSSKLDLLTRIIDVNNIKLSLVFCNTKKKVDELASGLQARGYLAEALHGDMKQVQRDRVMNSFRKNAFDILIATDVAARGIDVDDIEAVFNYDIPTDEEYYVHRIGRTGRAGRKGTSYTFVSGREVYKLRDIQRYTKATINLAKPPSLTDVEERKVAAIYEKLKESITAGHLSRYSEYVAKFLEDTTLMNEQDTPITSLDVAAAFLKMSVEVKATDGMKDLLEDELNAPKQFGGYGDRNGRSDKGGRNDRNGRSDRYGRDNRDNRDGSRNSRDGGRDRFNSRNDSKDSKRVRIKSEPIDESKFKDFRSSKESGGNISRLFLNVGNKDDVQIKHILDGVAKGAGVPGKSIGSINILDKFTFFEVPDEYVEPILDNISKIKINDRKVNIELANKKKK